MRCEARKVVFYGGLCWLAFWLAGCGACSDTSSSQDNYHPRHMTGYAPPPHVGSTDILKAYRCPVCGFTSFAPGHCPFDDARLRREGEDD